MSTATKAGSKKKTDFFEKRKETANPFLDDVLKGLTAKEKHLDSKYFYDAKGDAIFQKIMQCEEYYPTRCELEILMNRSACIAEKFLNRHEAFDVVELGAGDATKSTYLLKELMQQKIDFTYYPIDISKNVINLLNKQMPERLPGLKMHGLNGEYFKMLEKTNRLGKKPKVVLLMGGNIGNVSREKALEFCASLREHIVPGDFLMIGFDLVKNPQVILNAYNDKQGLTRDFNINLLQRINDELEGDFLLENFLHFPVYDPKTNACKSYLISIKEQKVHLAGKEISFDEYEAIFMEIAQKYTTEQTDLLATSSGFKPVAHFYDSKEWFLDTLWVCE